MKELDFNDRKPYPRSIKAPKLIVHAGKRFAAIKAAEKRREQRELQSALREVWE